MRPRPVLVLILAAVLVASGCLSGGGSSDDSTATPPPDVNVSDLREASVEATKEIDTARYEMTMTASMDAGSVEMDATGVLNRETEKLRLETEMNIEGDAGSRQMSFTTYFDGDTMYVNSGGRWVTRDVSDLDMWNSGTRIARQREMMAADAVKVSYGGSETVGGTETHVLVLTPDDEEKFRELLREQLAQQGQAGAGELFADSEIREYTTRYYVAKDSKRVRKVEIEMSLDHERRGRIDVSMTITYSDVNEDVTIEIPEEAKRLERPLGAVWRP